MYQILLSLVADSKLVCHKNVQSFSHELSTLQVEGKALHPFQIIWSFPFSEVLHEYGVSGLQYFCKFSLIKTTNVVGEKRYYHCILANHDKWHLTGE